MVRQRSAKPLFAGSIPAVASIPVSSALQSSRRPSSRTAGICSRRSAGRASEQTLHRPRDPRREGGRSSHLVRWSGVVCALEGSGATATSFARKLDAHVPARRRHQRIRRTSRADSPTHAWVESSGFGRLLCSATLFEDVVKIITTTNTMWRQTMRMTELLVEKCGRRRNRRRRFPTPEDVARFSADELQEDCRLGYRAKTIHALATGIADGSIDMKALQRSVAEYRGAVQELSGTAGHRTVRRRASAGHGRPARLHRRRHRVPEKF